MLFRAATLCLLVLVPALLWLRPASAAPVSVRFVEGVTHGFLVVRTVNGVLIASGDLLQIYRDRQVESRMVFRFKDGSVFDERVVFTQERVFTRQSYHLVQRGSVFAGDTEISLERASGKYRVNTKARKDGSEKVLNGTLDLPPDVYNGMVITAAKNLPKGASETVHLVAFTPTPRLIQLELAPAGEQKVLIGRACENRNPLRVEAQARELAQALRHAVGTPTAGLPRLDRQGSASGIRQRRFSTEIATRRKTFTANLWVNEARFFLPLKSF